MKTFALARTLNTSVLSAALALASLNASAALYDRGNGMIYDSTQNITWLQDANYAKTSGYDSDGAMNWNEAKTWADNLVYGGFSDWRLPSAGLNGTGYVCSAYGYFAYEMCPGFIDGTYDSSYNNTRSELGHLFKELGNRAEYSEDGIDWDHYHSYSGWWNTSLLMQQPINSLIFRV